jgi:hypothetical protein
LMAICSLVIFVTNLNESGTNCIGLHPFDEFLISYYYLRPGQMELA